MADLYLTPAERYTAALGGFYYGDLPEPGTAYTQLIKDILDGSTPDKEPKNILARFIYSLYISDLEDPYPRYELAKLLYWKLHDITPTKSGSILTVTIDGEEDYLTINTDLSRLWYKVLFGSKTDVITEFPYIFNTMQNKLSDWELFGNTVQNGTPTPDSPVMPQGTGERTGNLCPITSFDKTTDVYYSILFNTPIPAGTYTISAEITATSTESRISFRKADMSQIIASNMIVQTGRSQLTVALNEPCYGMYIYGGTTVFDNIPIKYDNIMLNTGSTPLPYEPSGVKIPISSANTTTPVYLGEVQTTRKIAKIDLGTMNWGKTASGNFWAATAIPKIRTIDNASAGNAICDMFKEVSPNNVGNEPYSFSSCLNTVGRPFINKTGFEDLTVEEFKQAMSGVYMYYVLAEPETGIVNEPLMKIGEYADSMSRTQTGIDIPTVIGQNTLDVLTTVKPSSMSIEYTSADENRSRSKRISLLKSPLKKRLIK